MPKSSTMVAGGGLWRGLEASTKHGVQNGGPGRFKKGFKFWPIFGRFWRSKWMLFSYYFKMVFGRPLGRVSGTISGCFGERCLMIVGAPRGEKKTLASFLKSFFSYWKSCTFRGRGRGSKTMFFEMQRRSCSTLGSGLVFDTEVVWTSFWNHSRIYLHG